MCKNNKKKIKKEKEKRRGYVSREVVYMDRYISTCISLFSSILHVNKANARCLEQRIT